MVTAAAIGRTKLQSNHYHQQTSTKYVVFAACKYDTLTDESWLVSDQYFDSYPLIFRVSVVL